MRNYFLSMAVVEILVVFFTWVASVFLHPLGASNLF